MGLTLAPRTEVTSRTLHTSYSAAFVGIVQLSSRYSKVLYNTASQADFCSEFAFASATLIPHCAHLSGGLQDADADTLLCKAKPFGPDPDPDPLFTEQQKAKKRFNS